MRRILSMIITVTMICIWLPASSVTAADPPLKSVVNRDDGVWLFPLPAMYYHHISDWAGCSNQWNVNGGKKCLFDGLNHYDYGDDSHRKEYHAKYGHAGMDIGAPTGTSVYAAAGGTYYNIGDWGERGKVVVIEHPLNSQYSYYTYYQHLNNAANIANFSPVDTQTVIGYVGSTGGNYAEHLHFSMIIAPANKIKGRTSVDLSFIQSAENAGWILDSGTREGRILVNPAVQNDIGEQTHRASAREHCGSVHYTADPGKVRTGITAPPTNVWLSVDKKLIKTNEVATFSFGAESAQTYTIKITNKNGTTVFEQEASSGLTKSFSEAGEYTVYLYAWNSLGFATYIPQTSFVVYNSKPTGSWIKTDKTLALTGENMTFTCGGNLAQTYTLKVTNKNGVTVFEQETSGSFTKSFSEAGEYTAYLYAWNSLGFDNNTPSVKFNIYNSKPTNPWVKASGTLVFSGQSIAFSCGADNAKTYTIKIVDNNGKTVCEKEISTIFTTSLIDEGEYTAYLYAWNSFGFANTTPNVKFKVYSNHFAVLTYSTVDIKNDNYKFDVAISNTTNNATLILATYNSTGKLIELKTAPITETTTNIPITMSKSLGATSAKVIVWDNLTSMQPLCAPEIIQTLP